MESKIHSLTDEMTGSFAVRTSSGTLYAVDMYSPREVIRLSADQLPTASYAHLPVADLRRDGEAIKLLKIVEMQVGRPGLMLLDLRRDGVITARTTTSVVSISLLKEDRN